MKYLYYKIYRSMKMIGTNDTPAANAMFMLLLCQGMNLGSMLILINYFIKLPQYKTEFEARFWGAFVGIIILLLDFLFIYRKRKEIFMKYENESKNKCLIGNIIMGIYIIGSFVLLLTLGIRRDGL